MPRILHYIDTAGPGGAETIFAKLVEKFSHPPYESVAMLAADGWLSAQMKRIGAPSIIQDGRGSFNISLLTSLWKCVRNHDVDLIQAHFLGPAVYGALIGFAARVPVVATFHGSVDVAPNERFLRTKAGLLRRGTKIVSVSESLRTDLSRRMSIDRQNITLIPNGIDTRTFMDTKPDGLRKRLGIDPSALLIGSLGNVRPAKDYVRGLLAISRATEAGLDVHWAIAGQARAGDGLLESLQRQTQELGIGSRVHFVGFLEEPWHFLADIDAYLLCSASEGHPLALMQAMAAGKPAVVTRCGVEQLFDDERYALFVNVGDDAAIAHAIIDLQQFPELAQARAAKAREYIQSHFDDSAMIAAYSSLYQQLLSGSHS